MRIRTKEIVFDRPEWLDSDMVRLKTQGVTVDSSAVTAGTDGKKIVLSGTPLGQLENGKYAPCTYDAQTGAWTPAPKGLAYTDVDVTHADAEVALMDWGRVKAWALPFYAGLGANKDAAMTALAKALPGITFVGYELTWPEG